MRAGSAIRRASGARRREAIDWIERPKKIFDPDARASTAAGFPAPSATPATTPSIAMSRRGRGEQPALIYDSPVTGTQHHFTYAAAAATK